MSDRLTYIWCPGGETDGSGYGDWGDKTRKEMIATYRRHAERMKAFAEKILATSDDDFIVEQGRGVYRRKNIKRLEPGE